MLRTADAARLVVEIEHAGPAVQSTPAAGTQLVIAPASLAAYRTAACRPLARMDVDVEDRRCFVVLKSHVFDNKIIDIQDRLK